MLHIKKYIQKMIQYTFTGLFAFRLAFSNKRQVKLGFLVEEFFHEDLRGFGGFGMLVKYITDYFNPNSGQLKADVLLTYPLEIERPQLKTYHHANVILKPKFEKNYVLNYLHYSSLIFRSHINTFISVDYYGTYGYPLSAFPQIPLIIWHQDPRDEIEWEEILSVPLEVKFLSKGKPFHYKRFINHQRESIQEALKESEREGRKIYFATQANALSDIGERLYSLKNTHPLFLPNPVHSAGKKEQRFSEKPSFLYLGRLDPIKRPWIFFELAKRMKDYDFYVAGSTHYSDEIDKIVSRYQDIPNLKFLGRILGQKKEEILSSMWALINPSIHEALPVSFLEAFAYAKPVISCRNPDQLVEKYGVYTGAVLGEGTDSVSLAKFEAAIEKVVSNFDKETIGLKAQEYVNQTHTFENYERIIREILSDPARRYRHQN
jgi:glycosyltransferase involved in cell wall biosynthesis